MGKERQELRLGKGATFFVKSQLKRLLQEGETWEADFRVHEHPGAQETPGRMDNAGRADDLAGGAFTLVCRSADDIMNSDFTLDDARQTIAKEYGFAHWSDVEARGSSPPDPDFEFAVDTLLRGDAEKLRGLLTGDPSLVHRRSSFGHHSTLLHYVGSNGVETYRQRVPLNLAEITRLLIEAGADVNATANMYGGGSTALGLLVTSDHPAKAGVTADVPKVLEAAGAKRN